MAHFINLTSHKSERAVSVNTDSIAWITTKEISGEQQVTVIHFTAAHAADALSLLVKEAYEVVLGKLNA